MKSEFQWERMNMRSISCAIISFVLFYIALHFRCAVYKGFLALLSIIMLVIAFVFMMFGI